MHTYIDFPTYIFICLQLYLVLPLYMRIPQTVPAVGFWRCVFCTRYLFAENTSLSKCFASNLPLVSWVTLGCLLGDSWGVVGAPGCLPYCTRVHVSLFNKKTCVLVQQEYMASCWTT